LLRTTAEVAKYRRAVLTPLATALAGYAAIGQRRWTLWCRTQGLEARLPASFEDLLAAVIDFADPVIEDRVSGKSWNPDRRTWA